jgi:RHS repeat-associated protein
MTATGQAVVNYTFDNASRLTQVAQGTTTLGFGYDTASRRTSVTLPNGIVGTFAFDNANELTGITYKNGSTQVGTLTYGYDAGSRRTSVGGTLAGFVPPNYVAALTYDGTNRLTSWGGTSLNYDFNGNLTSFGPTTYTWNARNQMTATSAGSATFAYDALGRRVSATVSGSTTAYLYDGLNPVTMSGNLLLASGNLDEIYAQVGSSSTTSYLRDGVNSTVALTSGTASISGNYYYSPYGDSAKTGTSTTPLQFTGRENDGATGLYYYRARYYSPQLGRFTSEDPIGIAGGSNFYALADGNPISVIDPLGFAGIPSPTGIVPGGPWTPALGQPPGSFYGPPQASGARLMCRWVPPIGEGGPPGSIGYWKTKVPGASGWERWSTGGKPLTPQEAHPSCGSCTEAEPGVEPASRVPWFTRFFIGLQMLLYSEPAY